MNVALGIAIYENENLIVRSFDNGELMITIQDEDLEASIVLDEVECTIIAKKLAEMYVCPVVVN